MDLGISGLASGFDWRALVDQLAEIERAPQQRWRAEQSTLEQRNNAYGSIRTQLGVLRNKINLLKDPSLFDARLAASGDSSIATASASTGTASGTYSLSITQLATPSRLQGATNIGKAISPTSDVSSVVLKDAGFATPVTAGTFSVNGKQISIETSETLQQVFDKISDATGGAVQAAYDPTSDTIKLTGTGEIVLGSATDTSNFLQVARLYNNGTSQISSTTSLGGVNSSLPLANGNFATPISDGGAGAGEFKINGVSISFNAATDSLATILTRINNSQAGVSAAYDPTQDRLTLTNKVTGDLGMVLEDVSGNFLAATGLTAGTLDRGKNLKYSINGGDELSSASNTITEASSGIPGLSITALKEGTTTVQVSNDTAKIRKAITDFIDEYNRTQSLIDTHTASSTDAKGKVTAGLLAGDPEAAAIASGLRRLAYGEISALSSSFNHLADIGLSTGGFDNNLTLQDSAKLDDALANHLGEVQALFTDGTHGVAKSLDAFLEKTIGDEGTLPNKQNTLASRISDLDTQIVNQERLVQAHRDSMITGFIAMETAQSQINQQMQFLAQQLAGLPS